jgi:hypothetical protein
MQKAAELKEAGYEIHVIHVDSPLSETVKRSWDRFKEEGRFVTPDYQIRDADDKPINTYNRMRDTDWIKSGKDIDNKDFAGGTMGRIYP